MPRARPGSSDLHCTFSLRNGRLLYLAVAMASSAITPTLARAEPTTYALANGLPVWDVATEDLNGDGVKDLLLLACDETSHPLKKEVAVFLASAGGQYPDKPTQVLPLDSRIGILYFAETNGTAPRELIAAHARGADVFSYGRDGFTRASSPEFFSLYPTGSKNPVFLESGAADMDGDGVDEWIVPVPEGYELRHGVELVAGVTCDMYSELRRGSSIFVYNRFPAMLPYDIPGSSTKGLAMLSDEFADFAHGEGWRESWRFKIPVNLEEKWEASSRMDDLNGDGFPDLVVTQTRGTAKLEAQTQVYLATAPYTYPDNPTATFVAKGSLVSPAIKDMNGDGNKDIVIINIPFGLKNIINFFTRGKVSADVDVYLCEAGGFSQTPAFKTSLTMEAPEGREQTAYAMGDFNGDKHMDIAFSRAANELAVYYGDGKTLIGSSPSLVVDVPSFGQAKPAALRSEERLDLVIFHPGGENKNRVEVILFD